MDLRQGKITLGEILRHPQARELLTRELPQFARSPLLGLAGGMTLNQILIHAKGRCRRSRSRGCFRSSKNYKSKPAAQREA